MDPSFEHKAGIQQAPQGLRLLPVRAGQLNSESAIEVDSPGNSPVPAGSASTSMAVAPKADVPAQHSRTDLGEPGVGTPRPLRAGRWSTPWLKPGPKAARGSVAAAVSPPPRPRREASRTPCGTPRQAKELRLEANAQDPPQGHDRPIGGATPKPDTPQRSGDLSLRKTHKLPPPGVRPPPGPCEQLLPSGANL